MGNEIKCFTFMGRPTPLPEKEPAEVSTFALDLPDFEQQIKNLIAEMYMALAPDNAVLIGTTGPENQPVQVQLIVTRNPADFMDEH